ncbi:MAG: expansin-like protein [Fibrobacterales bacterium]
MKVFLLILCFVIFSFGDEGHLSDNRIREGAATHFQLLGAPYGACGVPQAVLDYDGQDSALVGLDENNFVALNVFNEPGSYHKAPGDYGSRPLDPSDPYLGMYNNGFNCGRWIEITLGDECDSQYGNSGAEGTTICNNNTGWYSDDKNDTKMYAIVTDQCSDGNVWCRDSKYHVDIHTESLNAFQYDDGSYIDPFAFLRGSGLWETEFFNNRQVSWRFVKNPKYRGDIHIWYTKGSKEKGWLRLLFTNLPNGISGAVQGVVEGSDTTWVEASQEGDMGQQWIMPDAQQDVILVKVKDLDGNFVFEGRVYEAPFPEECGEECSAGATLSYDMDHLYPEIIVNHDDGTTEVIPMSSAEGSSDNSSDGALSSSSTSSSSMSLHYSSEEFGEGESSQMGLSSETLVSSSQETVSSSSGSTARLFIEGHESPIGVSEKIRYDLQGRVNPFCRICIEF